MSSPLCLGRSEEEGEPPSPNTWNEAKLRSKEQGPSKMLGFLSDWWVPEKISRLSGPPEVPGRRKPNKRLASLCQTGWVPYQSKSVKKGSTLFWSHSLLRPGDYEVKYIFNFYLFLLSIPLVLNSVPDKTNVLNFPPVGGNTYSFIFLVKSLITFEKKDKKNNDISALT